MKANIHPKYQHDVTVTCACGNTFQTGSTLDTISIDICSACHPFFTGEMKFVDTQGRVDKFQQKIKASSGSYVSKKKRRQTKQQTQGDTPVMTLKDMIQGQKKTAKAVVKADEAVAKTAKPAAQTSSKSAKPTDKTDKSAEK